MPVEAREAEYKPRKEPFRRGHYAELEREEHAREQRKLDERRLRAARQEKSLNMRTEPLVGTDYRIRTLSSPTVRDLGIVAIYGPYGLPMPYIPLIHRGADEKT